MRQRIAAAGGIGIATVLGLILLWGGIAVKPLSAMEKMAENIRKAKSYSAKMTVEFKFSREPDKAVVTSEIKGKVYWLAPRSYRTEFKGSIPAVPGGPRPGIQDTTHISPAGKPGIEIDHQAKTFLRQPPEQRRLSGLEMIENLGKFSQQADRDLGEKEIDGKTAHGFQIEGKKIDPEAPAGLLIEVWVDAKSNLPILLHEEFQGEPGMPPEITMRGTMRAEGFQWNIDLDPSLFDPTPPKGYVDVTPRMPSLQEQVRHITVSLKTYAGLCGGSYAQLKTVYDANAVHRELLKKIGIEGRPTLEQQRNNKKFGEIEIAFGGLRAITVILAQNPDAAYYGKTVGPKDKDKVLLRWKLDDGRYEVIFGDLRSETVTAEGLRALEGK